MEYWLKKMRDIDPVNAEILSEKINMNHTEEQAKISYLQSVKNNDQILLLCNTSPAGFMKISRNKDTYKINIYKNDTILVDYNKNYKNININYIINIGSIPTRYGDIKYYFYIYLGISISGFTDFGLFLRYITISPGKSSPVLEQV